MASAELSAFESEMVEQTIAIAQKHKVDAETVARVLHGMARAATEAWAELGRLSLSTCAIAGKRTENDLRLQETSRVDRTQDKASQ